MQQDFTYFNPTQVFFGRLDVREDEPPKLVCERMMTAEKALEDKLYNSGSDTRNVPSETQKKKRSGLFLRFACEDCPEKVQAEKLLNIFDGRTPLYYYYNDTGKYVPQPSDRYVDVNEPLLNELKRVLGDKNVVLQ